MNTWLETASDEELREYFRILATTPRGSDLRRIAIQGLEPAVSECRFHLRVVSLIKSIRGIAMEPIVCRLEREHLQRTRTRWS